MDSQQALNKVVNISNNDILPNRFQPRKYFDEEEILQLSESIKEHGLINPVIVRKLGDKYELVAGERRYKANILAGNDSIPAIIMDINDKESSEIAVVENVQRKDLNAIEEAISYKRILDIGYMTQEQLAQKMGKSQSAIANKIRLLKLSDDVQDALMRKEISERHARSLLRINSHKKQNEMLNKIIKERLTVRKLDEEIDKMNNNIEQNNSNQINNTVTPIQPLPITENNMNELVNIGNIDMPNLSPIEENITPIKSVPSTPTAPIAPEVPGLTDWNLAPKEEPVAPVAPAAPTAPTAPEVPGLTDWNLASKEEPVAPVAPAAPTAPIAPEVPGLTDWNLAPKEEPVAPVAPAAPTAPIAPEVPGLTDWNLASKVEPVAPVTPATPTVPQTPQVPEQQPINISANNAKNSTDLPWLSDALFSQNDGNNSPLNTSPIIDTTLNNNQNSNEMDSSLNNMNNVNAQRFETVKEPIITTDYNDQYDPIMPNVNPEPQIDFRTIINLIRECSNKIEKYGYKIETEEYNLDSLYQVVFKIEKK